MEAKQANLADALEHSEIVESSTELVFTAPKMYQMYLKDAGFAAAVHRVMGKPIRITIKLGDTSRTAEAAAGPTAGQGAERAPAKPDAAAERALEHPEVQKFQELFPGSQVRAVRDLRENEV